MATPTHHAPTIALEGNGMKIGIATAKWNWQITSQLEKAAIESLRQNHCADIRTVYVPGAVEVPLACQWLLENGCDAVIAFGCVIRGETTHYDLVCNAVERGCTELALKTGRPVVQGVLTVENEDQARERIGGRHGHKGRDAADVAIEMVQLGRRMMPDQTRV